MPQNQVKASGAGFKQVIERTVVFCVTLLVAGLALGMILVSTKALAERAAAVEGPVAAPLLTVQSAVLDQRDTYVVMRSFPGQIEAGRTVDMSFEAGGTIIEVMADEGDTVAAGDLLARLDTRLLEAELERLNATRLQLSSQLELAERTFARQSQLDESGLALGSTLDQAELGLSELRAQIAGIDASMQATNIQIDKSVLRAPFDATVAERFQDEGVSVGGGTNVISLLESGPARFRVGIDPDLSDQIMGGEAAMLTINGADYPVTLAALRPDLDPVTRTQIAVFEVDGIAAAVRQTGVLRLSDRIDARGFEIPVAALREGTRGLWTVLTLNDAGDGMFTVGFEAVELIHSDAQMAYVRGTLQEGQRYIAGGTHRVTPGQIVRLSGAEAS